MDFHARFHVLVGFERYGICAGPWFLDKYRRMKFFVVDFSKRGYIWKPTSEKIAHVGTFEQTGRRQFATVEEFEPPGNRRFWWNGVTVGERDITRAPGGGVYSRGISVV
jgi:hypothetical protein